MDEKNLEGVRASGSNNRPRFWRRQFGEQATAKQKYFDMAFGLVVPVLCLLFDPIIFKGGLMGEGGMLGRFQLFAYVLAALEITTLVVWLWRGRSMTQWQSAFGGVLLAGALFSLVIGVVILPLSLLGLLFFGIGALGFTPFLTAFVYLRHGLRAVKETRSVSAVTAGRPASVAGAFALGAAFALGFPAAAQRGITRSVNNSLTAALEGRELSADEKILLRFAGGAAERSFDEIVWLYQKEKDPQRKERLAKSYREITGRDIERRLMILLD